MALKVCTNFSFGTTAGWVTGNAGNRIFDGVSGSPTPTTATPLTGSHCLELSAIGSVETVWWDTATLGTSQTALVASLHIRFPGDLPTANLDLAEVWVGGGSWDAILLFQQSSGRLAWNLDGNITTGPVVAVDTWYRVDFRVDVATSTTVVDWRVDGAVQTQGSQAHVAGTIARLHLGWSTAHTGTIRVANVCASTTSGDFPIGAQKVVLLSVDPAGTVTLSGTTANFSTFTSNGTLTAWNATTARNNVDEVPPTVGATADGWVQTTNATTNYVQMPLTTYALQAGESVLGARMLACGWATSTTGASIGFRSFNGTTETVLFASADPNFDASTTTPAWVCRMLTVADINTQAELDALAMRAGFSGDASPDIGIHAIYVEVAVALPGATVVTGAAALSASGTQTAAGSVTQVAAAALTASGTQTAVGSLTVLAAAVVSASGTLTASSQAPPVTGAAALSADGTLTAAGTREQFAAAALTSDGVMTTAGTTPKLGQTTLSGGTTFTVSGSATVPAAAALSATAALTAAGMVTRFGAATLTASGILTAGGAASTFGSATLTGEGLLAAAGTTPAVSVALTATGTLTAAGQATAFGVVALTATGTLAAAGVATVRAAATLTAAGTLAAAGAIAVSGTAQLSADGSLTADGSPGPASLPGTFTSWASVGQHASSSSAAILTSTSAGGDV